MATPDCGETFRQEAQDLLEQLEQALLDLEVRPDDRELIDSAFRALHTLKGSGAMFGFERVAAFTHDFETAFDRLRKEALTPSRQLIEVALAAKDHIRALIEAPETAKDGAGEAILAGLRVVLGEEPSLPEACAPVAAEPLAPATFDGVARWRICFRLPADALVNGTNPLLILDELRALGDCRVRALTETIPLLSDLEPDACHVGWEIDLATDAPRAAIEEAFMFVLDEADISIDLLDAATVAENADDTAPDDRRSEPLGAPDAAADARANPSIAAGPSAQRPTPVRRENEGRRETDKGSSSLRVPAERLDELMDRVGELVIAQARLTALSAAGADIQIKSVAEEIERLAAALRDTTMGIRMLPIGSLFGRFRRLVHDLSRDLGKQVDLVTSGEETELDKTMIERLADPLVHMIRNAVDHGLELPDQRIAAGKSPVGRVSLVARHAGAEVLVSISDDGRGLDKERIRAKAEEQGLIAPGAQIADPELFQLLFHAGFSTAREVSAVSGRGVGMDVVKRAIDAMRGTIDVSTTPGKGTEVTLRLPLTLAIIDGLLVRVGDARYVIPLSAVEECVELSQGDDHRSKHRSFMNIRGDLVPFLRLRELFACTTPADPFQKVVIVAAGDMRVGLVVDQIIGSHQTVIKSLSKLHAEVETFSGATILGDGTVALILDIAHLVEVGQAVEGRLKASQREAA